MSDKRWETVVDNTPTEQNPRGLALTVTQPEDPAYILLKDSNVFSTPDLSVYRDTCYICCDPEFAQMGMPLCYACGKCQGHVAADDSVCDDCGADQQELAQIALEAQCASQGHYWRTFLPMPTWTWRSASVLEVSEEMTPATVACFTCGRIPEEVE